MLAIHPIDTRQELVDEALDRLLSINFAGVRMKLADTKEGKGWDDKTLDHVEKEYRRFLALAYAYPERRIVPDRMVDEFWHQHILDTRAYADDTRAIFGHFLHHFPYLGMRGPDDEERLMQHYSESLELHRLHFGRVQPDLNSTLSSCDSSDCSRCADGYFD